MIRAISFWRFAIPIGGVLLVSALLPPADRAHVAPNHAPSAVRPSQQSGADEAGAPSSNGNFAGVGNHANRRTTNQTTNASPNSLSPADTEQALASAQSVPQLLTLLPGTCGWNNDPELADAVLLTPVPTREASDTETAQQAAPTAGTSSIELTSYLGQGTPWFDPIAPPVLPTSQWPQQDGYADQSSWPTAASGQPYNHPQYAPVAGNGNGYARQSQPPYSAGPPAQVQPVQGQYWQGNERSAYANGYVPQQSANSPPGFASAEFAATGNQRQAAPANQPTNQIDATRLGNLAIEYASHRSTASRASSTTESNATNSENEDDPHLEIYSRTLYPSALECAGCHEQIYQEWALSNHAYASISPMFHKFEQKINDLASGTIGYFCLRCHAPVATTMGLRRDQPIWDGPRVFREGVTCVACHRVDEQYGKTNGERRMVSGDLSEPIYSSGHGGGIAYAIENADHFKVHTDIDSEGPGQTIHKRAIRFEQLSRSDFCVSCHQVAVDPQIKLEVVWDQYRASPAFREGITCQDCHMGRVPGVAEGYSVGPVAVISERVVNPARKHSNHAFFGPGGSIAHPGIFPHNEDADRWTVNEWLQFDWRAGWGTDEFEDQVDEGQLRVTFPEVWSNVDDRYDARDVLDANLETMDYKNELRKQVMSNGSHIDGPYFRTQPSLGRDLNMHYIVSNTNSGHNLPSGSLGAQPQVWLNVVLIGPAGNRLWESGYLDSNGDLADLHSLDVHADRVPFDDQLFNLQTKFLTTNVKGTDREMYLPVNIDIDQLPFLRPAGQPVSVINHPPFIRMEGHSIPPLGRRNANYRIPGELLQTPGQYRLSVRLRSRGEPIYFMLFVGATEEMTRAMNESIIDLHEYSIQFVVE